MRLKRSRSNVPRATPATANWRVPSSPPTGAEMTGTESSADEVVLVEIDSQDGAGDLLVLLVGRVDSVGEGYFENFLSPAQNAVLYCVNEASQPPDNSESLPMDDRIGIPVPDKNASPVPGSSN
ncbi:hypothetical protein F25303_13445 [Fusarium sp. NRRL 25303]|nr:hypothetical protein F25303_13445 [Fusarium sp. NRRL 25303]